MFRCTTPPLVRAVFVGSLALGLIVVPIRAAQQQAVPVLEPTPLQFRISAERMVAIDEAMRSGLDYVPGEVLVKFRAGVGQAGQTRALNGLRSRPSPAGLRWIGSTAVLRDGSEPDARVLARQLRLQPEVEYAEPNYIRRTHSQPTDPSYSRQWNMTAIDMPRAWDIQPAPGKDVIVAVIDTGVTSVTDSFVFRTWNGFGYQNVSVAYGASPDMASTRLLPGADFAFLAAGSPVLDMVGHGTHVAGTIAQEAGNGVFGAGVAYNAKILPLKVCIGYWELQFVRSALNIPGFQPLTDEGGCFSDAIAEAVRYAADNGAKVINMSLGGEFASAVEREAIQYAVSKGVFIATSMGNEFEDGNPTNYPAAWAPEIKGLVSVGAVGRSLKRSYYSSTGAHIEVAAPGGDTRDGGEPGRILQATLLPSDLDQFRVLFPRFNRYSEEAFQGTSMATPHVAGLAALLIAQGITRPADIETIITRTARDLGSAGRDSDYGYGLIQPRAALFGLGVRR